MVEFKKHAKWFFEEGSRIQGMWEPIYFQKMRGNVGTNQEKIYNFKRSRIFLEHLAEKGVNHVWFNWWKGYGLAKEAEYQDQVAELFPVCRELGIRAVCYHSFGSLTFDTLLHEEPDVVNWIARTQNGNPTSCQVTFQCFRYRPCFSSDGYLSYMEKVLSRAIDAGCDGIHFDNIGIQAEMEACHCERCQHLFREYLEKHYGKDLGEETFGLSDFTHASVPWFNQHNEPNKLNNLKVAHHRAWVDFKCEILCGAANRLIDFIHNKNPEVMVEMNATESEGFPAAFWRGNDCNQFFPKLEMVWDEGNGQFGVNSKGAMINAVRPKKIARSFGCAHKCSANPISMAMEFSEEKAISTTPYGFWKKYKEYQLKSESLARVAVLRERNSMTYNRWDPWEETLAVEQYLMERRIPFDMVHNVHLDSIADRYDLLIVAGMEIITDVVRDKIRTYVAQGGGVLLTGDSGVYDEHYRIRQQPVERIENMQEFDRAQQPMNAFHELIGPDPHNSGSETVKKSFGKGRAAWLNQLDVDRVARIPANWCHSPANHMLARNAHVVDELVGWLLPEGIGIRVDTVGKIYVHYARRSDTNERMVHLINHEFDKRVANATVELRMDTAPSQVVSISMDDMETYPKQEETFSMDGNTLRFRVDNIKTHRTAIIRM